MRPWPPGAERDLFRCDRGHGHRELHAYPIASSWNSGTSAAASLQDDLGSGFASFGYVKTMSVEYVNIEGSFVRQLVDIINQLGYVMDFKSIAEFVETEDVSPRSAHSGSITRRASSWTGRSRCVGCYPGTGAFRVRSPADGPGTAGSRATGIAPGPRAPGSATVRQPIARAVPPLAVTGHRPARLTLDPSDEQTVRCAV